MAGGSGAGTATSLGAKVAAGVASGAIVVSAAAVTVTGYDAMVGLTSGLRSSELSQQMREAQQATSTADASTDDAPQSDVFVIREATLTGKLIDEYDGPAFPITINVHADGTVDGTVAGSYTRQPPGYPSTDILWEKGTFEGAVTEEGAVEAYGFGLETTSRDGVVSYTDYDPMPWEGELVLWGQISPDYSFAGEMGFDPQTAADGESVASFIGDNYAVSAAE